MSYSDNKEKLREINNMLYGEVVRMNDIVQDLYKNFDLNIIGLSEKFENQQLLINFKTNLAQFMNSLNKYKTFSDVLLRVENKSYIEEIEKLINFKDEQNNNLNFIKESLKDLKYVSDFHMKYLKKIEEKDVNNLWITLYIKNSEINQEKKEQLYTALDNFLTKFGFELTRDGAELKGSIRKILEYGAKGAKIPLNGINTLKNYFINNHVGIPLATAKKLEAEARKIEAEAEKIEAEAELVRMKTKRFRLESQMYLKESMDECGIVSIRMEVDDGILELTNEDDRLVITSKNEII